MTSRNFLFSGGRERQICRERKSVVTMAAGRKSTWYYSPSFVSQARDLLKIQVWSYAPGLKLSKGSLLLLGWYPWYGVNSCMAVLACLYSSCMNSLAVWNDSYPTHINHPLFCHLMDQPIAPTISWVVFGVGEKLLQFWWSCILTICSFPCHSPAQGCTVINQQTSCSFNASSVQCIMLDIMGGVKDESTSSTTCFLPISPTPQPLSLP